MFKPKRGSFEWYERPRVVHFAFAGVDYRQNKEFPSVLQTGRNVMAFGNKEY